MRTGRAHELGLGTRARRRAKERLLAPDMAGDWKLERNRIPVEGGGRGIKSLAYPEFYPSDGMDDH